MNLINFEKLSGQQLMEIVDKGIEVKHDPNKYLNALEGKSLAMIFQKTSTRTRVAFEVAMTTLGGHALYINWQTTNFALADIYDETQYLSRNVNFIMARLLKKQTIHQARYEPLQKALLIPGHNLHNVLQLLALSFPQRYSIKSNLYLAKHLQESYLD